MMKTISKQLIYEIDILYNIGMYLFTLYDIPLYNIQTNIAPDTSGMSLYTSPY